MASPMEVSIFIVTPRHTASRHNNAMRRCQKIAVAGAVGLALWLPGSGFAQAPPALKSTPDGRPLELVFFDDFQSFREYGERGGVWRTTYGDGHQTGLDRRSLPTNGELELYVDSRLFDADGRIGLDPFRMKDGHLDIEADPTPSSLLVRLDGHPYVSGVISSQPSFAQTYGYFEMRAKIPGGAGLWPAFWLLPSDQSWPPEIDVMESVGDASKIYSTVHSTLRPAVEVAATVTPGAYHTYAVSWDAKNIIWYVDGLKIGEQTTPADLNKPMYMIANLAVGGNWPGPPDATTKFPAVMTIEYIRAYRFAHD
jgi:beta-glucanase (GH16 family)